MALRPLMVILGFSFHFTQIFLRMFFRFYQILVFVFYVLRGGHYNDKISNYLVQPWFVMLILYLPFLVDFPFAKPEQELSSFPVIMSVYLNHFKIRALDNKIPLPIIVFIWYININCSFLEIFAPNYILWSNFCKLSPKQCIRRLCNMGWPNEHFLTMARRQMCSQGTSIGTRDVP